VYIDGSQHGIENVFDAAYFAYYLHAMSATLTASTFWHALKNSVRYRMLSLQRGAAFPDESEWIRAAPADAAS
jgi:hypothetical protein